MSTVAIDKQQRAVRVWSRYALRLSSHAPSDALLAPETDAAGAARPEASGVLHVITLWPRTDARILIESAPQTRRRMRPQ